MRRPYPHGSASDERYSSPTGWNAIEELAELAAAAYVAERSNWAAQRNFRHRRPFSTAHHRQTFRRIAKLCVDNQINDIPGFFRVQFAAAAGRSLPPTPQHCCGPVALSRWNSRGDVDNHETVEDRQLQFSLEQQAFTLALQMTREVAAAAPPSEQGEWTEEAIVRLALADADNAISPLFRYSAAFSMGLHDLAQMYHHEALCQYLLSRDSYDQVWAGRIPLRLKREAELALAGMEATRGEGT